MPDSNKAKAYSKNSNSRWIILLLILACVILALVLYKYSFLIKEYLGEDVYKALWGIAPLAIVGGFISLAFEALKREQELRETRKQILRDFYSKAVSEYNKVKNFRRMIRAMAIERDENEKPVYLRLNECMPILSKLEACQLEFESLKKEIEVSSHLQTPTPYIPLLSRWKDILEKFLKNLRKVIIMALTRKCY